jgi:hypothetical protein
MIKKQFLRSLTTKLGFALAISALVFCFSIFADTADAEIQDGETVSGTQEFNVSVYASNYDYFDMGKLCLAVDGVPINKYNIWKVRLGNVQYFDFGSSTLFNLNSLGCTTRLYMDEDITAFDSVSFSLNTALLSNGSHELEITVQNTSMVCSGGCIPDSTTTLSFDSENNSLVPPNIYFNPELWNCSDCLAIGLPYTLTATFGSSALGSPSQVSLHYKSNGIWGQYTQAKFKNKKWVFAPLTLSSNTWIEVRAKFGKLNWYYKQLLKPTHRISVASPDEVRVGNSGTANFKLPGVSFARCVIVQRFYADYGRDSVKQFAANLSGGSLRVYASYSSSGSLDGTITCRVNGQEISQSWGWDVSYW